MLNLKKSLLGIMIALVCISLGLFYVFRVHIFEEANLVQKQFSIGSPFQLIDQRGDIITEQHFLGHPSAIFFGFTNCPEVCPSTLWKLSRMLDELGKDFDYIVCDSPAGIEHGAQMALYFAEEAVIVTNPEVSSVRDSDRIIGILQSKSRMAEQGKSVKEHLLLTRYNPDRVERGEMLSVNDVEDILAIPLLGVIPESEAVLKASNQGVPVVHDADSDAGQAYADAVARYLGEDLPHRFLEKQKKGFLKRVFGG